MITKRLFSILLCVLFVFCSVFITSSVFNIRANAQVDDNPSMQSIITDTLCCLSEDDVYVSLETDKTHFFNDENIMVSYYVNSEDSIIDINYFQNGFTVYSVTVDVDNPNHIIAELSCAPNVESHSISIQIVLSSNKTLTAMLYAITNEYGTFISPFSEDDARQRYFNYAKTNNLMTQDEYETIKAEIDRAGVIENEIIESPVTNRGQITTMATLSTETYVKGKLKWTDDAGNDHPLRRVMVRIYDDETIGETHLGTVYTDNNGDFSYTFTNPDGFWDFENGGYDIFVRIYAGDTNAMVEIGDSGDEYYYESTVSEDVLTGSTVTRDFTFLMSCDLGKAFQISQAVLTARDYAWSMMDEMPEDVVVYYPYSASCSYNRENRVIKITGNARNNLSVPHSYASWDVIMHEYGHHIQYQIGIINTPSLKHSSSNNNADIIGNKDEGVRLAWAESWPTVFGAIAQQYFSGYLSNIATIDDAKYTSYNGLDYNIESTLSRLGEACERSIMAVLWDLYDSTNDANDTISLGYTNYWNATTGNQSKTFSDFINYFYARYPEYIDDIGLNLTYYKMATTKPYISNSSSVSQTVSPSFTWTAQGGSSRFPNNKFALLVYNNEGEEILRIDDIYTTTYQLKQSEWNAILYNCTDTFTVAVAATQTHSPTTGEYISARSVSYNNPNAQNVRYSGKIQDNLRWSILEDGTLFIYGSGSIPNYSMGGGPWCQYKESIKNIVVTGADFIGEKAFYNLDKATYVYISDTVMTINAHAFERCTGLIRAEFEVLAGWMVWEMVSDIYIEPYELVFPDIAAEYLVSYYDDRSWTRDTTVTTSLSIIDSGVCGDGVYWALSSEYALRIYGNGEMDDFTSSPWAMYSDELTAITVASGVTHIGNYAFENCGNVTVMLFEGVLSIGESAFKGCLFSDITLPYSLTTIGAKAFAECSALTKIDILPEVTYIGERAFENCSSLTVMTVDSGNTIYSSLRNCIIEIASKTIIAGCNGSLISKDENITTIGRYAFSGCDFTTIYIPSTITQVEGGAFYGCSELTSVTVSINLTVVGESVFEDCTSLSSIVIPDTVTEIGANAFNGCTSLTELAIPASVRRIGEGAFAYSGITDLNFLCANDWSYGTGNAVSESTLENASSAALLLKDELVNWTIVRDPLMSEVLTSTMGWEISRNGTLIIYGSGCMPSYNPGESPWTAYADQYNALKIREGIYSIGRCAFYDLDNILSVSLPESLMVIDEYAFYECSGFSAIHIPAKVFSIGIYTMRRTAVTALTLGSPLGWTVNGIALSGDADEFYAHISGAVSNGVTIESYKHVFKHADLIEGAVIASGTFADGAMSWSLNDKGVLYVTGNGAMPTFNTGATPWADYRMIIRYVVIGEGITTVGRCAFYNCVNVESAALPSTVQEICEYAFYKCITLSDVTLCEGLTSIGEHAFNSCSALTEIDIPSTVTFIADNAFNKSGITL